MGRKSKRFREIAEKIDLDKEYSIEEAVATLQSCPSLKFDQTVDVALKLGVDPRKADQLVRGTVSLPNGTGQTSVVLVLCKGDKEKEALDAGADYAGSDEFITKIQGGWTDFSSVVATPDMMREVGKLGKVLGPRGLMPTPKAGTVTTDVATAVTEIKAGKMEFRTGKDGVINSAVGKISFEEGELVENVHAFIQAILRAKPSGAKGQYMQRLFLSSTMGPGLRISSSEIPST